MKKLTSLIITGLMAILLFGCYDSGSDSLQEEEAPTFDIPRTNTASGTIVPALEDIEAADDLPALPTSALFENSIEFGQNSQERAILIANNDVVDNAFEAVNEVLLALDGEFEFRIEEGAALLTAEKAVYGQTFSFFQRFDGETNEVEIRDNGVLIFEENSDFENQVFEATLISGIDNSTPVVVNIDVVEDNVFRRLIETDFNTTLTNEYECEWRTDPQTFDDLALIRLDRQ